MARRSSNISLPLVLLLLALLLVGVFVKSWMSSREESPSPSPQESPSAASSYSEERWASLPEGETSSSLLEKLAALPVTPQKGTAPYNREDFGKAWADVDQNGCDTRNDVLKRDLTHQKLEGACKVLEGDLQDAYTGKAVHFVRGNGALVDIDHLVALQDVALSGGDRLTPELRKAVANDPLNLLAVDAGANRAKGSKNASEWLPSNTASHCFYTGSQVLVKSKYGLSVTQAEHDKLLEVLSACG